MRFCSKSETRLTAGDLPPEVLPTAAGRRSNVHERALLADIGMLWRFNSRVPVSGNKVKIRWNWTRNVQNNFLSQSDVYWDWAVWSIVSEKLACLQALLSSINWYYDSRWSRRLTIPRVECKIKHCACSFSKINGTRKQATGRMQSRLWRLSYVMSPQNDVIETFHASRLTEEVVCRELVVVPDLDHQHWRHAVLGLVQTPEMFLLLDDDNLFGGNVIEWEDEAPVEIAFSVQRPASYMSQRHNVNIAITYNHYPERRLAVRWLVLTDSKLHRAFVIGMRIRWTTKIYVIRTQAW